jgi:cation diffusion facilitator family transporter
VSTTTKIESVAEREKRLAALASVLAGIFLAGMKLIIGLLTGSLGILSEAAHSGLDLIAALITFLAVRVSDKPADEEHLYGHGKVENFSALVETLLLLVTCFWIIYEAAQRIFFRAAAVEANVFSFGIMAVSVVVDIALSRLLYRTARQHSSQALEADALHYSSDIFSSLVVLLGLAFVRLGWPLGDPLAAFGVAILVIIASLRLGRRTVDALLDRAPAGLADKIEAAVRGVDGVLDLGRLRVRRAGSKTFVDMNVAVERNLPLEGSHAIATAIEERVHTLVPDADVVVHTDPRESAHESLAERIRTIASKRQLTVHNLVFHNVGGRIGLELHLEVDSRLNLGQAHALASQLEGDIRTDLPAIAEINTHIESRGTGVGDGEDITALSSDIVEQVRQAAEEVAGLKHPHRITVRRVNGNLSVSLHCNVDEKLSIEAVHDATSALEAHLREQIPHLDRVLIHVEPMDKAPR